MSQVIKKFITDNAVSDEKIRLDNNDNLRARNAANSGDVNIIKVNASDEREIQGSLIPSADGTLDLGKSAVGYGDTYTRFVKVASDDTTALDVDNRVLLDAAAGDSIDFENRQLKDSSNQLAVNYESRSLANSSGASTVDFATVPTIKTSDGGTNGGRLNLNNAADTFAITIKPPAALAASYTLQLPSDDGNASEFLQTNGSGVLTWAAGSGGATNNKQTFTLAGGDITNQYIDLSAVARTNSIIFMVKGGGVQLEGASYDYSVSYTGGGGGNTRITFLNDLATGGASALVAGDILQVCYES